jgi:hypothetical protein
MEQLHYWLLDTVNDWPISLAELMETNDTQIERFDVLRKLADLWEKQLITVRFDWYVQITHKWRVELEENFLNK